MLIGKYFDEPTIYRAAAAFEDAATGRRCNRTRRPAVMRAGRAHTRTSNGGPWILGLKGKSALVTGGSKGYWAGIAELFAAEGSEVAICARNADEVGKVVKGLSAKGVKSWGRAVDVADPVALKGWIEGRRRARGDR